MPQIQRGTLSGNCSSTYFFDLGGAHGRYRSKTLEEFALKMVDLGCNTLNIAPTNSEQKQEREFLEALGFKEVYRVNAGKGSMRLHATDSTTLQKALAPYHAIKAKKLEEEQKKKREAELKRLEEQKKRQAELEEKRKKDAAEAIKNLADLKPITSNEDVTKAWVIETYNRYPGIPISVLFNHIFGFKGMPDWTRRYDDDKILNSINSRLRRRRENAK